MKKLTKEQINCPFYGYNLGLVTLVKRTGQATYVFFEPCSGPHCGLGREQGRAWECEQPNGSIDWRNCDRWRRAICTPEDPD